jgi:adenine-specific DNA-methyltransferase
MIYPRLRLASNLLTDDGVIFISIDDNEITNLRKICDEVFGEENFIEQIVWQKRTSPDARKKISAGHEYVLMYAKDINYLDDALNLLSLSEKDKENFKNPDNDPRGPWVSSDFTAQGFRPNQMYTIVTPGGAEYTPAEGRCWKNVESVFLQQVEEGRMWFGSDGRGVPRRKTYLNERTGKNMWTWWPNSEVGHTQEATQEVKSIFNLEAPMFDFPKPSRLIKRMVQMATNPNNEEIILDFFSGSGTTAHAVMQLNAEDGGNRKFIMVQLPEVTDEKSEAYKAGYKNICEIGKERIRRAGAKIKQEWEAANAKRNDGLFAAEAEPQTALDTGFKVFKLDTSNLKTWDSTPVDKNDATQMDLLLDRMNDMIDTIKNDRTDLDIVYEVILKMGGVDLTDPVEAVEVEGARAYTIGEGQEMLLCLQGGLTVQTIERMADEFVPSKMILSEKCFADDTAMANAHYFLKERGIELKLV